MFNWGKVQKVLKLILRLGFYGVCACALTGVGARAQNYPTAFVNNQNVTWQDNAENMTIGEMLANSEPLDASGYASPEPIREEFRSTPFGQSVPVRMMRYDAPVSEQNQAQNQAQNPMQTRMPVTQATHREAVRNDATPVRVQPPQVRQIAYEEQHSHAEQEPKSLPQDYPAGEMIPMNPSGLIAFSETTTTQEGPVQQVTIIEPNQKVLCVYHVNMNTGQIELKSARKIEWDLQLLFLNSKRPLPQDVQAILEQNQKRRR